MAVTLVLLALAGLSLVAAPVAACDAYAAPEGFDLSAGADEVGCVGVEGDTTDATPSAGPYVCRYVGGSPPYYCIGVYYYGGQVCVVEWLDERPSGGPFDGDDTILTIACV